MAIVLPLTINALYLKKAEQVIGQDIQFEYIPWMNKQKDVFENPNTPFNTHSIIPRPFSYDNAIYLKKGVHLHFMLPDVFKKFDIEHDLPRAPNRWFIRKERQDGSLEQEWIIESDYIWDINDPLLDKYNTCSYIEDTTDTDFQFKYVGRCWPFSDWLNRSSAPTEPHLKRLTAMGWGSMSFDMHYANCRTVFGFHDAAEPADMSLYTVVGWVSNCPQSPIVAGKFVIDTSVEEQAPAQLTDFNIAIGNTLPEALTALILKDAEKGADDSVLLRQEEQIEAILNFDALNDQKLDWISRLRHKQHENQFSITKGTTKWILQKNEETGTEDHSGSLPSDIDIESLNTRQNKLEIASFNFFSKLESLYIDWTNYLAHIFQRSGIDLNRQLKDLELKKSQVEMMQLRIISLIKERNTLKRAIKGRIPEGYTLINKNRTDYYEALPPSVVITCSRDHPFLNIYNTEDPAIPIDNNDIKHPAGSLGTAALKENIDHIITALKMSAITLKGQGIWKTYKVEWEAQFASKKKGHYLNNKQELFSSDYLLDTYRLDEQYADMTTKDELSNIAYNAGVNTYYGQSYVSNTVQGYLLSKIDTNLVALKKEEGPRNVSLINRLETFRSGLSNSRVLELSLSDFNHLMIQRSGALSILPLIPNGYTRHQQLAASFKDLFTRYKKEINLLTSNKLSTFNPLRNGAFTISRLRIIDCFGREKMIRPEQVITTWKQCIDYKPDWVALPPRLLQPATVSARFVRTETKTRVKKDLATNVKSPVVGWMVPVYLNQRIEFFDAFGKHLGAIDTDGSWQSSPFDISIAVQNNNFQKIVSNTDLRRVIIWLIEKVAEHPGFQRQFIDQMQHALEHIAPEDYSNPSLLETIASIPIAITRININLFTKGEALYNLKNDEKIGINTQNALNDFTNIKIPLAIGDINQYNDGLLGYWNLKLSNEEKYGVKKLDSHFYLNDDPEAIIKDSLGSATLAAEKRFRINDTSTADFLQSLKNETNNGRLSKHTFLKYYTLRGDHFWQEMISAGILQEVRVHSEDLPIKDKGQDIDAYLAINEHLSAKSIIALLHPTAKLFFKTGILPQKEIRIPYNEIKNALKLIELTLLTSPVLTPKNKMEISLQKDNRYKWSWVALNKTTKNKALSAENPPVIKRVTQDLAINLAQREDLKISLEKSGLISSPEFFPREEIYFVHQDKLEALLNKKDLSVTEQNAIDAWENSSDLLLSIEDYTITHTSIPELVLKEGWLSIKSTKF